MSNPNLYPGPPYSPGSSSSRLPRWLQRFKRSWAGLRAGRLAGKILNRLPQPVSQPLWNARIQKLQRKYASQLAELQQRSDQNPGQPLIIFPPGLDWDQSLFQRPQHLALALARQGALVFYVQPPERIQQPHLKWIQDNLLLCSLPIEVFTAFSEAWLYLLTWNAGYDQLFAKPRLIYDYVDDLHAFNGNLAHLQRQHERLLDEAELVLATAADLYQRASQRRSDVLLCPNGVDYQKFSAICPPSEKPLPPADLSPITHLGQPIIGYYGALARWFDYELLQSVAGLRPMLSFVLIGPDHDASLPPELLELPNVHWLGAKPYDSLTDYLAWFSVAIIPFRLNAITHATSPLKLFEYMAACKPTVITPMQESQRYPGVLVGGTPQAFSERLDEAISLIADKNYLQTMQEVARANTWQARADQILQALQKLPFEGREYNGQSP